jgi:hypothetical protein
MMLYFNHAVRARAMRDDGLCSPLMGRGIGSEPQSGDLYRTATTLGEGG